MSINIESLVKNLCYWHTSLEMPEPYKPIFIQNKCKLSDCDQLDYLFGIRLTPVDNSNIIRLSWLETSDNYCFTYFDWNKIVERWMYVSDLKNLIE